MKLTIMRYIIIIVLLGFMGFGSELFAQGAIPPKIITDSSQIIAERIVQSKIPVFIDFWAVWCGPCKILNPIIDELEKEYKGKVLFVKINVDIHKEIAQYFQVQAIPSIFLVNNKTVVKYFQGVQPKEVYVASIKEVLQLAKNEKAVVDTVKK